MPISKRIFDVTLSIALILILTPLMLAISIALLLSEGSPIFYISERMRTVNSSFRLYKFRTMKFNIINSGVTGGDKADRSSRVHQFLRKSRIDELPQLWNVLRGDMSFVGPRPPLRKYVEDYPQLYGEVLENCPGVTGLASLRFHNQEELLLKDCKTARDTDTVYRSRCIPRKATLDLIYAKNWSLCFDIKLICETAVKPFRK